MKDSVLITGGAGYIGSHVVKRFLKEGRRVVVVDNFLTGFRQALENLKKYGDLEVIEADLTDLESLKRKLSVLKPGEISTALHFASLIIVSESMVDPYKYFRNNFLGALNLLESMKGLEIKRLIFSSTCAVYGNAEYLPIDEKHPFHPTNTYGESKFFIERTIDWYSKIFDMRYVIFRYFNVTGADPDSELGYSSKASTHLIQNAVKGALGIAPFHVTCPTNLKTRDGTPVRDYVDIVDMADAHLRAYEYLSEGKESNVFNLGSGNGFSVYEIINEVEKILGVKLERNKSEPRAGEYEELVANYDKAKKELGWEPSISLGEGIKNLANWFKKYPTGFEN